MEVKILRPRQSLNKAFLKVKPSKNEFDKFLQNLTSFVGHIQENESEEYHKNLIADLLKSTYYHPKFFINTNGRNYLVVHNENKPESSIGVILEVKRYKNTAEMCSLDNINKKAFRELVLYYLRERITNKNIEIKHLIATNIYEWFIFDATLFDKLFAQNKILVQQFTDFEGGRLAGRTTDFFYENIAKPFIDHIEQVEFTYFNLRDFKLDDKESLIPLFKLLSPEHLLKLPFINDSNTLDKGFYNELLHIIGLSETKQGNKKLIGRNEADKRYTGSIIEDSIIQLDALDKLERVSQPSNFGATKSERLYNVALELSITWINRILFLKLLEAQLLNYHKGDSSYSFLNSNRIKNYDDLNALFFQVLARNYHERNNDVKTLFNKISYLNSSLFEPTELEQQALFISNLKDDKSIPIYQNSVLKDQQSKRLTGNLNTLEYLFAFLDAYDFGAEGDGNIQEDNKTLINSSVLGLIFEKINGYKDGSYFTPGFITMYMCKESIRRAVVQKFNDTKSWSCQSIVDLYNKIDDKVEANNIINSLKICDPAVGSGHFLVSALNEIIAIKYDLGILLDQDGRKLKDYTFQVANDELIITDEDGKLFEYRPNSPESQRIQKTIFHEKQTIIESCLFGVDINPNSVKICRLRLWIELLKHTYYKNLDNNELETLPNIDINIKCGNSLVSRFAIDIDIKDILKKNKIKISEYRNAVDTYRNAKSKEEKREMEKLISQVKSDVKTEIAKNDPKLNKLETLSAELYKLENQHQLFELSKKEQTELSKRKQTLVKDISTIEQAIEDIKSNKIYENAFEWRFEFPEVLNDAGDFIGFDVVIGNPPYGAQLSEKEKKWFESNFNYQDYQLDTYLLFIERAFFLMKSKAEFSFIIPNTWITNLKFKNIRKFIFENSFVHEITHYHKAIFDEAVVDTELLFFKKDYSKNLNIKIIISKSKNTYIENSISQQDCIDIEGEPINITITNKQNEIKKKMDKHSLLNELVHIVVGLKPYQKGKGKPEQTEYDVKKRVFDSKSKKSPYHHKLLRGSDINKFTINWTSGIWLKYGDHIAEPRYSANFFHEEKIVVRQTGDTLIAMIDYDKFLCMNNLHVITKHEDNITINLKYILAILNSKLLDFYYTLLNPEKGEALAEVKKEHLSKLPINLSNDEIQKVVENIVNEILSKKSKDPSADTSNLENKIDQIVYQIYGLTEEEINIVEGTP